MFAKKHLRLMHATIIEIFAAGGVTVSKPKKWRPKKLQEACDSSKHDVLLKEKANVFCIHDVFIRCSFKLLRK